MRIPKWYLFQSVWGIPLQISTEYFKVLDKIIISFTLKSSESTGRNTNYLLIISYYFPHCVMYWSEIKSLSIGRNTNYLLIISYHFPHSIRYWIWGQVIIYWKEYQLSTNNQLSFPSQYKVLNLRSSHYLLEGIPIICLWSVIISFIV